MPGVRETLDPTSPTGRAMLDALVTQQSTIISFMDDYRMLMLLTLAAIPLLMLLRQSARLNGRSRSA